MAKQYGKDTAVIYARFSSHKQDEQSIEGQLRDCYTFAEREGLEVIGEYIDRAISGTTDKRPDFQRLIADSNKNLFRYVIVWKLDRFARSVYDSLRYEHELSQNNVTVLSAAEGFGKGDEAFMIKGVKRYMNEYYSKDLSMKTKRGMRESVLKGNCIGGTPLYGYKFVDKKIVIDEEKAEVIRYVFEEYAKGKPKSQINRELNAKGVRNQAGNPLSATSFQGNLKNKKYIGIFNYNGVDYYDVYPAIISENVFKKVQDRLKARAYAPSGGRGKVDYLLYGKAFCGICGNTMIGDSSNNSNGVRYDYYSCIKRKNYNVCTKKRVRKEELEIYVVEQTKRQVLTPNRIEQVANSVVSSFNNNETNIKIGNMQKRIVKINRDIDKCFNIILDTDNPEISKRADKKAKALQQQKEDIEVTIARLKLSIESRYSKEQIISWLTMHSNGDVNDIDYRRKIIDIFIKAVFMYDEKVVIYYNVSNNDDKNVTYEDNSDFINSLKGDNNVRVYKAVGSQEVKTRTC